MGATWIPSITKLLVSAASGSLGSWWAARCLRAQVMNRQAEGWLSPFPTAVRAEIMARLAAPWPEKTSSVLRGKPGSETRRFHGQPRASLQLVSVHPRSSASHTHPSRQGCASAAAPRFSEDEDARTTHPALGSLTGFFSQSRRA